MANTMTGELYTPPQMECLRQLTQIDRVQLLSGAMATPGGLPRNVVEVTEEQYAKMEGMTKQERITYLGKQRCPCGSRKKRSACCG